MMEKFCQAVRVGGCNLHPIRLLLYPPSRTPAEREDDKVLIYAEHHSVCPLVGIGTHPTPLPQASVPPSPGPKGEGAHSPGEGEFQLRRLEKLALCLLCGADTLPIFLLYPYMYSVFVTVLPFLGIYTIQEQLTV
jgi:hypothetical protein